MKRLTTNSIPSTATVAIVASGNAPVSTVIARVVVPSICAIAIVATPITPIATDGNIAAAASASRSSSTAVVVACNVKVFFDKPA